MTDDAARDDDEIWRLSLTPFPRAAVLTGGHLDRADALRDKPHEIARLQAHAAARALVLWNGKPLIALRDDQGGRIAWTSLAEATRRADAPPIFLGLEHGAPRFAVDSVQSASDAPDTPPEGLGGDHEKFIDLRSIAADLPQHEAAVVAQGKSLCDWRRTHLFCARCGAPSEQAMGGWRRDCPACGAKHFPRTDPVVIMLIERCFEDGAPRVVLGRQKNWPPKLYSLLAGYIEPGETIEEAVRRETREEAGVRVGRVTYLTSQPWPFPSTLMIGCYAEALDETLTPDFEELDDCAWITREEAVDAFAGRSEKLAPPRRDAIAGMLLRAWVDGLFDR